MMKLEEDITIPVKIGDTILTGRFKNKKVKVQSIGKDEHGMPTINGRSVTKFRMAKTEGEKSMPKLSEIVSSMLNEADASAQLKQELEQALKKHDWFYQQSDDPKYGRWGAAERDRIRELMVKIGKDAAKALWDKHAPKNQVVNTFAEEWKVIENLNLHRRFGAVNEFTGRPDVSKSIASTAQSRTVASANKKVKPKQVTECPDCPPEEEELQLRNALPEQLRERGRPQGEVQQKLMRVLAGSKGRTLQLTDLARHPEFVRISFKRLMNAAGALNSKGLVSYSPGTQHIALTEASVLAARASYGKWEQLPSEYQDEVVEWVASELKKRPYRDLMDFLVRKHNSASDLASKRFAYHAATYLKNEYT